MIGERLGNYRLVANLGSGSMGVVFLAEHQRLARRVAIKLLAPELVRNQQVLQRFFNEARATSLIRHPGIVDVFDCDVDANGRAYMVMEHLEGETLGDRLRSVERLPWTVACAVVRQAADALGAVHDKGIVHRDLKPENVFLVRDPRDPAAVIVKVLDFGVAKLLAVDAAARLTMRGTLVGTPEYMSPEQCGGSEVDHRTDVYALGCILFEMLSGQPPFGSSTVEELIASHRFLPTPSVRASVAEVPGWLEALLARMLAKEPGQRPSSMREISEAIRANEDHGVAARAAPTLRPEQEGRGGHRRHAGAIATRAPIAIVLAGAVLLAGAIWSSLRRPARDRPAVTGAAAASREVAVTHSTAASGSEPAPSPAALPTAVSPAPPLRPATAVDPRPLERSSERTSRAARRARPAGASKRTEDVDGIVDL